MEKSVTKAFGRGTASGNNWANFICAAVLLVGAGLLIFSPSGYLWFAYEDGILEWAQCYCLIAGLLIALRGAYAGKSHRALLLLIAICCLYVVGEEISWGQRLFNFASPPLFDQFNLQHETNLHNFLIGPYDTLQKRLSEWGIFVVLILAALYRQPWVDNIMGLRYMKQHWLPTPPRYVVVFLVAAAFLELRLVGVNEAEFAELFIYFSTAVYVIALTRMSGAAHGNAETIAPTANRLFAGGVVIAVLATVILSQIPNVQRQMQQRFAAGKLLFAQRYQRLGLVHNSAALYQQLVAQNPDDMAMLRSLANLRRLQGDEQGWRDLLQQAVRSDQRSLQQQPATVKLHLSLFESFAQLEQRQQATYHIQTAARLAAENVTASPESGEAAYWLGRVFQIVGKKEQASAQYARAVELDPANVTYRQEYYRAEQL